MSPHFVQLARVLRLPILAMLVISIVPLGCALFPPVASVVETKKAPFLPPIQTSPEAIQLDVVLLERPADDRLLSTAIWKEVDQVGALSSETRESLRANGFQMGIVGSNPPPAVQRLLGMAAEIPFDTSSEAKPLMGRHQYLPPGMETEIATSVEHEQCEVEVRDSDQVKLLEFERANCVLRMKAHRLRDGWVRVDFQPEIHHGDSRLRQTTSEADASWALRGGQKIDVRNAQKFSLEMNVGELVLVTAMSDDELSLGDRFFCHEDRGLKKQRVLVVRVVGSGAPQAIFSN